MPAEREAARALLVSCGVDAAVGVAWQFSPEQIRAAVTRWEERRVDGDDLGPGWIVWLLRQGPVDTLQHERELQQESWLERRYRGVKGI